MRSVAACGAASVLRAGGSALLAVLAGCGDGLANPNAATTATVGFVVELQAAASRIGYTTQQFELRLQPYTVREDGARALLGATRIESLESVSSQQKTVMLSLDLRDCFNDPARARSGDACPLRLDVSLMLANGGLVLDHQLLGPWPTGPGVRPALDTLHLAEVGPPEVFPRAPTLDIGATVKMFAKFVTVRGDTVTRPVTWRSESPSVASVDDSGLVTALAKGNAIIVAHFGAGQSSNGERIVVR